MSYSTSESRPRAALIVIEEYLATCSACGDQTDIGHLTHDLEPECGAQFVGIVVAPGGSIHDAVEYADLPIVKIDMMPDFMVASLFHNPSDEPNSNISRDTFRRAAEQARDVLFAKTSARIAELQARGD